MKIAGAGRARPQFRWSLPVRWNLPAKRNSLFGALRGLVLRLAAFAATLVFATNQHSGNGVLKDELRLGVGFQHDGILVIRAHAAGELGAVQQMYGDVLPAGQSPV